MSYLGHLLSRLDPRRRCPRIAVEALCTEYAERHERHAFVVDMSAAGLRIERPFEGGKTPRIMQLEFELPGVDEVIWARGEVCFDRVVPASTGLVRRMGLSLVAAARDLRTLRDYVFEMRRRAPEWLPPGADEISSFTLSP
jgi:hypothetical protein